MGEKQPPKKIEHDSWVGDSLSSLSLAVFTFPFLTTPRLVPSSASVGKRKVNEK